MKRLLIGVLVLGMTVTAGFAFAGEKARDGRFIAYRNGTVLDTQSHLMWVAKDNGSDIDWSDANDYCRKYRGGGHYDWRMPTQKELATLYDSAKTYTTARGEAVHLTKLIQLSSYLLWAANFPGESNSFHIEYDEGEIDCDFSRGECDMVPTLSQIGENIKDGERVLPVRSGN